MVWTDPGFAAHEAVSGLTNLLAPLRLDAAAPNWPIERADAVVTINMVHISPWQATQGLMVGQGVYSRLEGALSLRSLQGERRPHGSQQRGLLRGPPTPKPGVGCP
ncbi:DUF938 domain-containing protein [Microvirga sp. G4-2]|uniref:DUF938 domain-containing protein n=1 Tax=Microvirga sp. G4-2 TaxID=3434467 RepID=UPI00404454AF